MNHLVKCSSAVAMTRSDGSGVRRVRIWKGTAKERLVAIGRAGMRFAGELPPEILADEHLIVEPVESAKPARKKLESDVEDLVTGMKWEDLVAAAEELGLKTNGVKKKVLQADVIAKLADGEKSAAIEKAKVDAEAAAVAEKAIADAAAADEKKGERVQLAGEEPAGDVDPADAGDEAK